jgi:hypothetical protein
MSLPSNGITPEVIREMMPPYQLSADLLAAALAAVPAPPPGATQAWRQERAARLVQEFAGLMPADAPQARLAAQILIVREATDDTFARANAPGLTVEQVCRLRRTAAALTRTASTVARELARRQQHPAPFFGTVLADGIDITALDAVWCAGDMPQPATGLRPGGEPETAPRLTVPGANPMQREPDAAPTLPVTHPMKREPEAPSRLARPTSTKAAALCGTT